MKFLLRTGFLLMALPMVLMGIEWKTLGFYRIYGTNYRPSLFNPQNRSIELLGLSEGPHSSLFQHLSLEAQALSLSWQIDLMGSVVLEEGKKGEGSLKVTQLYFQKDLFPNLVFIAGRSIQRWGTGYAFNPTDVVAPSKELSDPDNKERQALGKDMVKLEYYGENFSIGLCCLTQFHGKIPFEAEDPGLAFRIYKNLEGVDLSLIGLLSRGKKPLWGGNFSFVFGSRLEVHGEFSFQKGSYLRYHPAINGEFFFYDEDPLEELKREDGTTYSRILLGFQYTFPGGLFWILEYFHQDQGYSRKEWQQLLGYARFLILQRETPVRYLAEKNILWNLNIYSPKGSMRDYLMSYNEIRLSKRARARMTVLLNLADLSRVLIPQMDLEAGKNFTFYLRSFIFQGREETEFGAFFCSFSIETGMRLGF